MNKETIVTPYGAYAGVTSVEYFPDGKIKGVRLGEKNVIVTHAGELYPFYGDDSPRRKYKSTVTFHPNGMIRAVSLEKMQDVMTPVGELPAELVTFYDTGELKRVFPLDGKISGFWTEEDERPLNIPLNFDFEFASFSGIITGICFYKSGDIRSLTLFPGETVDIKTAGSGTLSARQGFSLYEDGKLKSLEPALPTKVLTPAGALSAYDPNAIGVNADSNSLRFDEQGRILSLISSSDKVFANRKSDGASFLFSTKTRKDVDNETLEIIPVKISFDYDGKTVILTDEDVKPIQLSFDDDFIITSGGSDVFGCSSADCASCSLCSDKN